MPDNDDLFLFDLSAAVEELLERIPEHPQANGIHYNISALHQFSTNQYKPHE